MNKLKKCNLTIEISPNFVNYTCPYCESRLSINYDDFACDVDIDSYDYERWEGKVTF